MNKDFFFLVDRPIESTPNGVGSQLLLVVDGREIDRVSARRKRCLYRVSEREHGPHFKSNEPCGRSWEIGRDLGLTSDVSHVHLDVVIWSICFFAFRPKYTLAIGQSEHT